MAVCQTQRKEKMIIGHCALGKKYMWDVMMLKFVLHTEGTYLYLKNFIENMMRNPLFPRTIYRILKHIHSLQNVGGIFMYKKVASENELTDVTLINSRILAPCLEFYFLQAKK
jgi:hypothetical protein